MLGNDHPTRSVIQADGLTDSWWNLDPDRISDRRRVRDGQDDDKSRRGSGIAGRHEADRAVLILVAAKGGLTGPQVIIANNQAGLRLRQPHWNCSLHQVVEVRVLSVHFRTPHRIDNHRRDI